MYIRNWKWVAVALCCCSVAACSLPRGQQCSSTCSKPATGCGCASKAVATECANCGPTPVIAVKPCPGKPRTFFIAEPTCNTCTAPVVKAPCTTCPTPVVKAPCTTCPTPKAACSTCPNPAVTAPVAHEPQAPRGITLTPRPLDPGITSAKPAPTTKADANAAFRDHRDPATGDVRYDHARDFSWVVGELQYLHTKKQWRVRYAPVDVEDQYGGSVTLSGVDHLADQLKSGATVRLQGQLIDPESSKSAPDYHVYGVKTLE